MLSLAATVICCFSLGVLAVVVVAVAEVAARAFSDVTFVFTDVRVNGLTMSVVATRTYDEFRIDDPDNESHNPSVKQVISMFRSVSLFSFRFPAGYDLLVCRPCCSRWLYNMDRTIEFR